MWKMIGFCIPRPWLLRAAMGGQRNLQVEILAGICNSDFGEMLTKGEYLPLNQH